MKPPKDVIPFESELATFWFDSDGIMLSLSKPVPRTIEILKKEYELLNKVTNGQKVCLLADASKVTQFNRAAREYINEELPKHFKAIAVISSSMLGYFICNVYLSTKKQPIPMKFFKDTNSAKEWLLKFL